MGKVQKNARFNLFTFIEIMFAFSVITITLSVNLGYADRSTATSNEVLYYVNVFTVLAVSVTILGIIGTQLMQIHRKTCEIGLHKAIGARDADIVMLVYKDTLRFILIPAFIGIILGIIAACMIPLDTFGFKPKLNVVLIFASIASVFLFTAISGVLPVIKAIQMNAADVLRKHNVLKHEHLKSKYNAIFYLVVFSVILGGIYINHSVEAKYKEDVINTSGPPPATSQPAPAFMFQNERKEAISSGTLEGRRYCLLIWEVGCPPSIEILDELSTLVEDGKIGKADIYAVSIDESAKKVQDFISKMNLSIDTYVDYEKSTKWAFNADSVPAFYVINERGMITARVLGWSEFSKEYLVKSILK